MFSIKTVFADAKGNVLKTNRAKNPNSATMLAFNNMQMNTYGADTVDVYDEENGELHAQFKLHKDGSLTTYFKRDNSKFKDPMRRSRHALIG